MEPRLAPSISEDFADAKLGDARLVKRLRRIADAAERSPGASLPQRAGSTAALEATYRFLENGRVTPEAVFDAHVRATVRRAASEAEILIIHDTTEFRFGGEKHRNGLGWINSTSRQQGFLAHFSICASLAGRPLGSLALHAWARHGETGQRRSKTISKRHPDRESVRWQDAALLTSELLRSSTKAIHVMDREGDSSELLALLLEHDQRFVVRLAHDRRLEPGRGRPDSPKLFESMSGTRFFFKRKVRLSARGRFKPTNKNKVFPPRESRIATLEVRAGVRKLGASHAMPAFIPRRMTLRVVEVREVNAPRNEEPVLWRLVTTEPVDTQDQVAMIVDAYRQRWMIEEFFKVLKTGCRYQQLQLEDVRGLLIALAIEAAVAWRLLLLRWAAQHRPNSHATDVLAPEHIQVLSALALADTGHRLPRRINVRTVLFEVARLGGHIPNNGPPGWLVLRRGFDQLLAVHRGWHLAAEDWKGTM